MPWVRALIALNALPCAVLGPVDRVQGVAWRMSKAWRARRSAGQPFAGFLPCFAKASAFALRASADGSEGILIRARAELLVLRSASARSRMQDVAGSDISRLLQFVRRIF